jgi:hypothetical protein
MVRKLTSGTSMFNLKMTHGKGLLSHKLTHVVIKLDGMMACIKINEMVTHVTSHIPLHKYTWR